MNEAALRVTALTEAVRLVVGHEMPDQCPISVAQAFYRFLKGENDGYEADDTNAQNE